MMANLFSSFDPSTYLNTSMNWTSSLLMFLFLPSMFWLIPSRLNMIWVKMSMILHNEFKILLSMNSKKSTILFSSLFMFILLNNFLGLFPYIFTSTSFINTSLTMSIPLWLSFMLFGWIKNTSKMFTHLVPQGAPNILVPFLVLIESISNIIRPLTLAIRLTANMIAGHLLVTLLGNSGSLLSTYMLSLLIITQIMLLILEFAVSIIQSYVFSILTTLYSSEV